jgi:hypothetical protein
MSHNVKQEIRDHLHDHPEAKSSCWTRDEQDKPQRAVALAAGLEWLLRSEQPAGAVCHHLGTVIHFQGNRYFKFMPQSGQERRTIVVLNVAKVERDVNTLEVRNPLPAAEADEVAALLQEAGHPVVGRWGEAEFTSFEIRADTSPTLKAAVDRYCTGCTVHPSRGPLCECGWHNNVPQLVLPDVDAVSA